MGASFSRRQAVARSLRLASLDAKKLALNDPSHAIELLQLAALLDDWAQGFERRPLGRANCRRCQRRRTFSP